MFQLGRMLEELHQRARALGEDEAQQALVVRQAVRPPTMWRMCSLASSSCVRSSVFEAVRVKLRRSWSTRPCRGGQADEHVGLGASLMR
jgi:ribosomal protein L15E